MNIPHNWETERVVIGGLLLAPDAYPEIAAVLAAEDFSRPNHVAVYRLIAELHARREPADIILFLDEVQRRGIAEDLGGTAYLCALPDACVSTDGLVGKAHRVRDHATRRRLAAVYAEGAEDLDRGDATTPELLDAAQARLDAVARVSVEDNPAAPVADIVDAWLREATTRTRGIHGVPTGFVDLDHMLCGLHAGEQVILAARPAMGKTSLLLAMARAAAATVPVGIFSLEMSKSALVGRLICMEAGVDAQRVRKGDLDSDAHRRLAAAAETIHGLPIVLDDRRGPTAAQIRERARRMARESGVRLFFVDYLQLLGWTHPKANAEQNTSHNSRELRNLWGDLAVPGVVLSQLNRSLESRQDKRPVLSDLRDSGAVEQDADTVLFIYRDEVYTENSPDAGTAEILIAKQRNGPIGRVRLAFEPAFTRFRNLATPDRHGPDWTQEYA